MNEFADRLVNMLLGVMRVLVDSASGVLLKWQESGRLEWIGEHWKTLAVVFVVMGLAVDLLVWVFRWQPYYVWTRNVRRFFAWIKRKGMAIKDPNYRETPDEVQEQQRREIMERLGQMPVGGRAEASSRQSAPETEARGTGDGADSPRPRAPQPRSGADAPVPPRQAKPYQRPSQVGGNPPNPNAPQQFPSAPPQGQGPGGRPV